MKIISTVWFSRKSRHFSLSTKLGSITVFQSIRLSLLQAGLDPSGEGSATWVFHLHSALFSTSIRSTHKSSMLYFTTSIHRFSGPYLSNDQAIGMSCRRSVCQSICHKCIAAKRCIIMPKLLLINIRKLHIGFQIICKSLTLDDLEGS